MVYHLGIAVSDDSSGAATAVIIAPVPNIKTKLS